MKIMFSILLSLSLSVMASHPVAASETVSKNVSILQAIKIGTMLTGSAKLTAPLIGVYDERGARVGELVGWDGESAAKLRLLLELDGTTPSLDSILTEAGVEQIGRRGPTIVAISLGEACEPCKAMELGISGLSDQLSDATVLQLTVNTSRAP